MVLTAGFNLIAFFDLLDLEIFLCICLLFFYVSFWVARVSSYISIVSNKSASSNNFAGNPEKINFLTV